MEKVLIVVNFSKTQKFIVIFFHRGWHGLGSFRDYSTYPVDSAVCQGIDQGIDLGIGRGSAIRVN